MVSFNPCASRNVASEHLEQKPSARFGRRGLADVTIARRFASLSSYFEFVRVSGDLKLRNPLKDLPRRWHKEHSYKAVDDVVIDQLLSGITNLRDRLMFSLFLASGLRVSEGHQLNRDTIEFEQETDPQGNEHFGGSGEVVGKGGKRRKFFIDEPTLEPLAEHLEARQDSHPAHFLSERKQRLSVRAIQYTLATWCTRLGLRHINVHAPRSNYATTLLNAGCDSMILRRLMGHNSLSTTLLYAKVNDQTLATGYFSAMEFRRTGD
jgi:integrase/recombinase XerC